MRLSWMLVAALAMTGCVASSHTVTTYAVDSSFHTQIENCAKVHDCAPLCVTVLRIDAGEVDDAMILSRTHYGARIACLVENGVALPIGVVDDDSISWDDDDTSCEGDSSCDDGGDDGMDDGSDGGGSDPGDGGDDGGGDDGGDGGDGGDNVIHGGVSHHLSPSSHL